MISRNAMVEKVPYIRKEPLWHLGHELANFKLKGRFTYPSPIVGVIQAARTAEPVLIHCTAHDTNVA